MDAQKQRQLQYFKQRHAFIPVNPDSVEFLERFENADATRRRLLELQRLRFDPTKAVLKAQKRRKKKQSKGKSNLRGEVAQIKRQQRITRDRRVFDAAGNVVRLEGPGGLRRYKETEEPRIFGDPAPPDLRGILAAFAGAAGAGGGAGGGGGFHFDPAVELERARLADLADQRGFQIAQDRLRLEGRQLDINRQLADRDRAEGQRRFNIEFAEDQRLNTEDVRRRNRLIDFQEAQLQAEQQEINRELAARETQLTNLANLNRDQLVFEQEREAARLEEEARQFDALREERLAQQQGARQPDEIEALQDRLRAAERDVEVGQAVEQDVRRRADEDRRQAADRDAAAQAELRRLAAEVERARADRPDPEIRIQRVEVPSRGLSAADREFLRRGLERVERGQTGIFEQQEAIAQHLIDTGRDGDRDAEQSLIEAADDQFSTPTAVDPRGGGGGGSPRSRPPRLSSAEARRRREARGGGTGGGVTPRPDRAPRRIPPEQIEEQDSPTPRPTPQPTPDPDPPQPDPVEAPEPEPEPEPETDDDDDDDETDDDDTRSQQLVPVDVLPDVPPEREVGEDLPSDIEPTPPPPRERPDPPPPDPIPPREQTDTEDETTDSEEERRRERIRRRRSPSPRRSPRRRRRSPSPPRARTPETDIDSEDERRFEEARARGTTELQRLRAEAQELEDEYRRASRQFGTQGFVPFDEGDIGAEAARERGLRRTQEQIRPQLEDARLRLAGAEERNQTLFERIELLGGRILGRETPEQALRRVEAEAQRRRERERDRGGGAVGEQQGAPLLPPGRGHLALTQQDYTAEELARAEREALQTTGRKARTPRGQKARETLARREREREPTELERRIETLAEEPAEEALAIREQLLKRVVPAGSVSARAAQESAIDFDQSFAKDKISRIYLDTPPLKQLKPTGFVLQNPYDRFVAGVNPGGRVNILGADSQGNILINTGQGSTGIKKIKPAVLGKAIRQGDIGFARGEAPKRPPGSIPKGKGSGSKKKK